MVLQRIGLLVVSAVVISGCTAPARLEMGDLEAAAKEQQEKLIDRAELLESSLELPEALAFALDNNLEFRLQSYQAALATGNRKLASMSMLPTLTAQAGYRGRNKVLASTSESIETGQVSLVPSTSSDKEGHDYSLEAGWNFLDFGLAWFRAREFGEQMLIAEEERRRVAHQLAIELIDAWDKAVAFKSVEPQLRQARKLLDEALNVSELLLQRRLKDQIEVIEYRKELLLILRRINRLSKELNQSQDELLRLLGMPAGIALNITSPPSDYGMLPVDLGVDIKKMQFSALLHRPEMRQALYNQRSIQRDTLRRTIESFPSLLLKYGISYDSNSFLVHNQWQHTGASLSLGLMRLATFPMQKEINKNNEKLADSRVELQAAAILSQVAMAEKAWHAATVDACLSGELAALDDAELELLKARGKAAAVGRMTIIKAKVDNLLFRIESSLDHAKMRQSSLMLLSSMGVGPVPDTFHSDGWQGKAEEIRAWLDGGMQANMLSLLADSDQYQASIETKETPAGNRPTLEISSPLHKVDSSCATLL